MTDSVKPKPSFATVADQIRDGVEGKRLDDIPGVEALLEDAAQQGEAIRQSKVWADDEKKRKLAVLDDMVDQQFDEKVAVAAKTLRAPYDAREGQVRQALTAPDDPASVARELKAMRLSAQAASAEDPAAVFADAELAGDDLVTRATGAAVLQRLGELQAKDAGKPTSKVRDRFLSFKAKFEKWCRAHPTAAQQLADIERERTNAEILLRASADHVRSMYKLRAPRSAPVLLEQPEVEDSRIRVGPAFDAMAKRTV